MDAALIGRSSTTSNMSATTASAPATPAWPPSTPCYRYAALRPPRARRPHRTVSSPSPPNASNAPTSPSSNHAEIDALLAAPDRTRWIGRRDHALLVTRHPDRAARLRARQPALRRRPPRATAPTSNASGKDENSGPRPSPPTPSRCSALAERTPRPARRTRCSRPAEARPLSTDAVAACRQTRRHRRAVLPDLPTRPSHLTSFATRPP